MKNTLLALLLSYACLVGKASAAEGSLSIKWPRETLLPGELFSVTVCFTNKTSAPVKVIRSAEMALARRQLQFSYETSRRLTEDLLFDNRVDWEFIMRGVATETVPVGGAYEWSFLGVRMAATVTYYAVSSVKCHLMVGEGRWVCSSAQAPVRFLDGDVGRLETLVFTGEYSGEPGETHTLKVYSIPIDGETFIFTESRLRLCRVPAGEAAVYGLDADNGVFTVSLPSLPRPVKYYLNTGELEK